MENKIIPTAEEFFRKFKHTHSPVNHHLALIEFAKLHVEQALKEASEKVVLDYGDYLSDGNYERIIDRDSILNSYPLSNIK